MNCFAVRYRIKKSQELAVWVYFHKLFIKEQICLAVKTELGTKLSMCFHDCLGD